MQEFDNFEEWKDLNGSDLCVQKLKTLTLNTVENDDLLEFINMRNYMTQG